MTDATAIPANCQHCGQPVVNSPILTISGAQYHPGCYAKVTAQPCQSCAALRAEIERLRTPSSPEARWLVAGLRDPCKECEACGSLQECNRTLKDRLLEAASYIERTAAPGVTEEMARRAMRLQCFDCDLPYDDPGFADFVVPHDTWAKISPTGHEGGLLCAVCMCRRAEAAGLSNVPGKFTSGPFAIDRLSAAQVTEERAAFHDAWVECQVASATGNPDLYGEKRDRLLALHAAIRSQPQTKGEG